MTIRFAERTWEEIQSLDLSQSVAILPVGATEAHGPHLPLSTDVIIAEAMALAAGDRLKQRGMQALILPPMAYSTAVFAEGFSGTISLRPATATALIVDIANSLASAGIRILAIANSHLDPGHIGSIYRAIEEIKGNLAVVFPDITRKPWALRLTDEFKSGACHAGQYESSIVMAERPELVKEEIRKGLPANPVSLSVAIRTGKSSFTEAGGPRAYFGAPSGASADEGKKTIEILASILEEAIRGAENPAPKSK